MPLSDVGIDVGEKRMEEIITKGKGGQSRGGEAICDSLLCDNPI